MKYQEEELSFKERVNSFLAGHWKLVVLILSLVAIAMAAILIIDKVGSNRKVEAAMLAEDIQEAYVEWTQSVPEERDDEVIEELISKALEEYPKMFAAQRAYFTRGLMSLEKEAWTEAAEAFETLAETWKECYLAPVSLFNAGSAREQAGDNDKAKELWVRLLDEYSGVSPDAPETLFNLGRISESSGNMEEAVGFYKDIASKYPDSRWTDLAKSRILDIEG